MCCGGFDGEEKRGRLQLTRDEGPHHLALGSHACVGQKQVQSICGGDGGRMANVRCRGHGDDDDDDIAGVNCVLSSRWMSTHEPHCQLSCNERLKWNKGGELLACLASCFTLSCTSLMLVFVDRFGCMLDVLRLQLVGK